MDIFSSGSFHGKSDCCSGGIRRFRFFRSAQDRGEGVIHIKPNLLEFSRACCIPTPWLIPLHWQLHSLPFAL